MASLANLESELHVTWEGNRIKSVVIKRGGDHGEIDITAHVPILEIKRHLRPGNRPVVEVTIAARLVEHRV